MIVRDAPEPPVRIQTYDKYFRGSSGKMERKKSTLSAHFKLNEFSCQCDECNETLVAPILVHCCEVLRVAMNEPLKITSGYRCPPHNLAVGGEPNSFHMQGMAVDIRTLSKKNMDLMYIYASKIADIGAIGRYIDQNGNLSRLHIDVRQVKPKVEWELPA